MASEQSKQYDVIIGLLKDVVARLDALENTQSKTQSSCTRMDDHIDFIDDVYESLRHPMEYMMGRSIRSKVIDDTPKRNITINTTS